MENKEAIVNLKVAVFDLSSEMARLQKKYEAAKKEYAELIKKITILEEQKS